MVLPHGNTELVHFPVALQKRPYVRGRRSRLSLRSKVHGGCCLDRCFAVGFLLLRRLRRLLTRLLRYPHRCGLLRLLGRGCMRCRLACCLFQTCLFLQPHRLHLDYRCPVLWRVFFVLRKCCPTLCIHRCLLPFLSLSRRMLLWPVSDPGWD